jgi:hypothetical protein
LPSAYIIGVPKCGTTDLDTLVGHDARVTSKDRPGLATGASSAAASAPLPPVNDHFLGAVHRQKIRSKEARWWAETIGPVPGWDYTRYIGGYTWASAEHVHIDSSPRTVFLRDRDLALSAFNAAEALHIVDPATPLWVQLRDPTARSYSYYKMLLRKQERAAKQDAHPPAEPPGTIAAGFHLSVVREIAASVACMARIGVWACVMEHRNLTLYGGRNASAGGDVLIAPSLTVAGPRPPANLVEGLYPVYLHEWRRVFGPDALQVGLLEQLAEDPAALLTRVLDHFRLPQDGRAGALRVAHTSRAPANHAPSTQDVSMWRATEWLLRAFHCEFNAALSSQLSGMSGAAHAEAARRVWSWNAVSWNTSASSGAGRGVEEASGSSGSSGSAWWMEASEWEPPSGAEPCGRHG